MPRLKPLWLHLDDVASRSRRSDQLFITCDFDGTVVAIAEHPGEARLSARTRELIGRLAATDGVHLAVISGRSLDDLEEATGGGRMFLGGAAGLETRDEEGRRQTHVPPDYHMPEALRASLEVWCQRFPGSWVEDKRAAYSLHYRAVAPALQPAFGAGVRRRVRPFREQVQLVHGKRVFEIMPAVAWEKSAAVRMWLDARKGDGLLFYFGDDTNDEPVYSTVRERGGIAVAVGRTVSAAEYVLPSPAEVVWFLEWLEREWTQPAVSSEASERTKVQA
ncbi:MAG: trehalose-phosphatase [Candidatus Eisenbacteria bacterium]|uniref:Trehalose 6-phosphate phosphatase n=1 Tax=Eiseniibacteriota bacterium TaxID=2212470 RepID=A0A9D6L6D6_UNCEI|nr:trehalose-phosphatase [Candidatus Eisenbacteria bacterium]MBI3539621.1 trehalose-phosphatase [Candidatus Eisenbacteria bacterium]